MASTPPPPAAAWALQCGARCRSGRCTSASGVREAGRCAARSMLVRRHWRCAEVFGLPICRISESINTQLRSVVWICAAVVVKSHAQHSNVPDVPACHQVMCNAPAAKGLAILNCLPLQLSPMMVSSLWKQKPQPFVLQAVESVSNQVCDVSSWILQWAAHWMNTPAACAPRVEGRTLRSTLHIHTTKVMSM